MSDDADMWADREMRMSDKLKKGMVCPDCNIPMYVYSNWYEMFTWKCPCCKKEIEDYD